MSDLAALSPEQGDKENVNPNAHEVIRRVERINTINQKEKIPKDSRGSMKA